MENKNNSMSTKSRGVQGRIPLSVFLIIPFALLFAIIIAVLTLLAFQKGMDAVDQIKVTIRERTIGDIRKKISEYINTAQRMNKETGNYISKGRLDIYNPLALQDFFWNQLQMNENINYIHFSYKDGGILLIARQSDGRFVVRQTGADKEHFLAGRSMVYKLDSNGNRLGVIDTRGHFDSRERPWFKKAVIEDGPIWTDVYTSYLEKTLGFTAACPLRDKNGNLLGVISTDIVLSTFNTVLNSLKPIKNSELFIMDKQGRMISSTADKKPFIDDMGILKSIHVSQSQSQVIRTAYTHFRTKIKTDTQQAEVMETFEVNVAGENHLVKIFSFRDKRGIDWLIGLTVSEKAILGPGRNTPKLIIYFGLIALILSILLCIFLGNRLMRPLMNLRLAAQELFNGNMSTRAAPSRIIELNTLASSFNAMAVEIQSYIIKLQKNNRDLNAQIQYRQEAEKKLRYFKEEIEFKQRTKLAGELHDGVGQSLQAINLGLKMLGQKQADKAVYDIRLKDLISEVGSAIEQLRDVIEKQYPVFLDQMDIQIAIEHYGQRRADLAGFQFILKSDIGRLELDPVHKEPIFLIFQEALINSTKYAEAEQITVTLHLNEENSLIMIIEDNGKGFNIEEARKSSKGLGLSLMRERAQSIGGILDIETSPNLGTRITMEFPLND